MTAHSPSFTIASCSSMIAAIAIVMVVLVVRWVIG